MTVLVRLVSRIASFPQSAASQRRSHHPLGIPIRPVGRAAKAQPPRRTPADLGPLSTETPLQRPLSWATAAKRLIERDPVIKRLHTVYGAPKLRPPADTPFASLVRSITHQQIATAAAQAISGRLETLLGEVSAQRVLELSPDELRGVGLSWNKVESIRDLAQKTDDGAVKLDPDELRHMSDADIAVELINVRGIGRWSAEIFLTFHMRRLDVWPTGDFSVRVGYGGAWGVEVPTPKVLDALGDPFRPYRSVVAYYTWKVSADPDVFAAGATSAVT